MKALARDLEKLGLSEKEAMVYLAALETGPAPVQAISRKAEVNRATTYVMIEALMQKGLMSTFDKGKKSMFTAEKPERLHRIVHHERATVDEKEQTIKKILPDLDAICAAAGERPKVSFYEGEEGLEAMRETIFEIKADEIQDFISFDDLRHLLPQDHWKKHNDRLAKKKVAGRTIYTSDKYEVPAEAGKHLWEFRRIPKNQFPMHGELTVYGNKVAMVALKGKLVGVIIESKEMALMVRSMFDLAWLQAEKFPQK
jgi:sugar-specific transcriptional regulator TrmB